MSSSQSQPCADAKSARPEAEPSAAFFSVVFPGDLRRLSLNPFSAKTPFGTAIRVGFGDAFAEFDEFTARYDALLEALRFVSADPCFPALGSVTHDTVHAALRQAEPSEAATPASE